MLKHVFRIICLSKYFSTLLTQLLCPWFLVFQFDFLYLQVLVSSCFVSSSSTARQSWVGSARQSWAARPCSAWQYRTARGAGDSSTTEQRVGTGSPLLTQSDSRLPRVETLQSGKHNNYHHRHLCLIPVFVDPKQYQDAEMQKNGRCGRYTWYTCICSFSPCWC